MNRRYFEGIDIDLPFFRVRLGEGGVRLGTGEDEEETMDMERLDRDDYREVRRRVRARLRFLRHAFTYLAVNTALFLFDWSTGGGYWVQWVALIWGLFLAWEFISTFVAPVLWGSDLERRLIERELRRRRGA